MARKHWTAGEACTREVVIARRSTALNEAARDMRERHVGSVVVVEDSDDGPLVVGMLTDRDIVTAVVAKDMNAATLRVGDVMSSDVVTAREGDRMDEVLARMRRRGIRRVPVTGSKGRLVGLLAVDDVLRLVTDDLAALVDVIGAQSRIEQATRP